MTDIDLAKPIRTRDGRSVEIVTDKGRGRFPLLGYAGYEIHLNMWARDGKSYIDGSPQNDIANVPERKEWFCNVYRNGSCGASCPTTARAALAANPDCRAIIRLAIEDDRLVSVDIVERFGESGE